MISNEIGAAGGGSRANLSDHNAKNGIAPVAGPKILDKLAAIQGLNRKGEHSFANRERRVEATPRCFGKEHCQIKPQLKESNL